MPTVKVNRVLVGAETFTAADRQDVADAIALMRTIMLGIGLHLEFDLFKMSVAEAGRFVTITSFADAEALTHRVQAGRIGTVDMFIVKKMTGGAVGWSPVGGSCDKRDKGMTGIVVSLEGGSARLDKARAAFRGNTFAHELGHYLGLSHASCADPTMSANFMLGGKGCSSGANTGITGAQQAIMRSHCSVQP